MSLLRRTHHDDAEVVKGPSLARAPALLLGTVLVAFGLAALTQQNDFPSTGQFPDGTANGGSFLGFELNGWTDWLLIAAGATLLLGAAQHALARTTSLLVGLVLGAASVIALRDGDDVLGLAAANGWTKLGLGAAAAWLLLASLLPRARRRREVGELRAEQVGPSTGVLRERRPEPLPERDGLGAGRTVEPRVLDRHPFAETERTGRFDRAAETERTRITEDVAAARADDPRPGRR